MKNKITKLFLALLAFALGGKTQAQEQSMPDYVREATNIEFLKKFSEEKALEFEKKYSKAVEIAKQKGLPISGEEDGKFFSLVGYEEETGALLYNSTSNNSPTASSLQTANAKGLHADGIVGAGLNVGVWDGGVLDISHLAFVKGSVNRYGIKDSGNNFLNFRPTGKQHAAHVAGTVAAGEFGTNEQKGFAYGSNIFAYNWERDTSEMSAAAANTSNAMFVSNHSYGLHTENYFKSGGTPNIFGLYGPDSREYDEVANNAPYYTIVFAAGNDRQAKYNPGKPAGKDLLSQAGVSKNVVVVAATRGTEDFTGITGGSSVGGANPFIAPFSNYGPTNDFRIKPDIAAKGMFVSSVGVTGNQSIDTMSGTSMAAPAVTGVFALWQDYHNQQFERYMKSATVRALMAHTAKEAGPAPGPDFMFGWGLIDAGKGKVIMDAAKANTAIIKELKLPNNTSVEYNITYDAQDDLVVTIAWNDPAATAEGSTNDFNIKKLVNDLDVVLVNTDTGKVFYPWSLRKNWTTLPSSNSIADNSSRNDRDNIEKIEFVNSADKVAGNYKIIVNHIGTLQGAEQDFTLVVSGVGGQMPVVPDASVDNVILNNLSIYPNPVDSVLNISGDLNTLSNAEVNIFDASGKKIKNMSLNFDSNNASIDVSSLVSGVYIMVITKDGANKSYKFIKK